MGRPSIGVLFFSAIIFASLSCYAEQIAVHLDDREWEIGYKAKDDTQGIAEFVLKGETIQNWTELVTAQTFFGLQKKAAAKDLAQAVIKDIKSICPDAICNIIKNGSKDLLFEWEIKNCPGQEDQHEISRVISGKEGIHLVHYVTKKLPLSPEKRNEWIKLLSLAALTK